MRFADALDRKEEEIKRPPNLPLGDYIFQVQKLPETREAGDSAEIFSITALVVEPTESVMPEELEEYGKVAGVILRKEFFINTAPDEQNNFELAIFNITRFIRDHCGVDMTGKTLKEAIPDVVNQRFMGAVTHRPDKNDPEIIYQGIGKTAPVE